MNKIRIFDPFNRSGLRVEELFRHLANFEPQEPQTPEMRIDVKEDDRSFTVFADIPGVNKEDVRISVDRATVSIEAVVKRNREPKEGERVLLCELHEGRIARTISLSSPVNQERSYAKYENGVLELFLPKEEVPSSRIVPVS